MAAEVKHPASISMISVIAEVFQVDDERKPAAVGEILVQEFMEPMGLTQSALAKAM
jgi:hypothetical protein